MNIFRIKPKVKKMCEKCEKVKVEQAKNKKFWIGGMDVCERCFYKIKRNNGGRIRNKGTFLDAYLKWRGET